jgi:hypothetical protein
MMGESELGGQAMTLIQRCAVGFLLGGATLLAGCTAASNDARPATGAAPVTRAAATAGTFSGTLTFTRHCPNEGGSPIFAGRVEQERIFIRAARGLRTNAPLDAEGRFAAEGVLRAHELGTKMQSYTGRVADGVVAVEARFVVPGYPQTECVATGRFPVNS